MYFSSLLWLLDYAAVKPAFRQAKIRITTLADFIRDGVGPVEEVHHSSSSIDFAKVGCRRRAAVLPYILPMIHSVAARYFTVIRTSPPD